MGSIEYKNGERIERTFFFKRTTILKQDGTPDERYSVRGSLTFKGIIVIGIAIIVLFYSLVGLFTVFSFRLLLLIPVAIGLIVWVYFLLKSIRLKGFNVKSVLYLIFVRIPVLLILLYAVYSIFT